MVNRENINLKPLKFACIFLIIIGLCLYFTNLVSPAAAAIRSYFLLSFTMLFLIFGMSFSGYEYTGYKRYFLDRVLKFFFYAILYSIICCIVILIPALKAKNNYNFSANAINTINATEFLFINFWFIPTGLIILLTLPFLDKLIKKFNYSIVLFISIVLLIALNEIIAPIIQNNGLHLRDIFESLRYFLFYGLITLIGLSHNKLKNNKNRLVSVLFIIVCLSLIVACLIIYGYSYNLINHFYPPTFFLLIYHLLILSIFYILSSKLSPILIFLNERKFIQGTSNYLIEIIFVLPVFLYLLSLLFNALKITDFFDKHFAAGFFTYLLCSLLILLPAFLTTPNEETVYKKQTAAE